MIWLPITLMGICFGIVFGIGVYTVIQTFWVEQ